MTPKWLIYCRVSSKNQVKEWNGLSSQESKCRRYATEQLWIPVEKVFNEDGTSGWIFERKSIRALLEHIDANTKQSYIVIFEDLNRLSRDIQVHNLLRTEFRKRWVELQCPNFKFEETPEWGFKENISVVVSQYEREKNLQRVIDRQTERLMSWFYCYPIPVWYKYIKDKNAWGKIIVKDTNWKAVKSALEKYANNQLESLKDAQKYLKTKWVTISHSSIATAFWNILYTWYYTCEKMGITKTKGKHLPLITENTYQIIQDKLHNKSQRLKNYVINNKDRIDISSDFPLRGFLYCEKSKHFLSAWWSQWKNKKFPYYTFPKTSPLKGKSLNRDIFHWAFEEFLEGIQLRKDTHEAFKEAINMLVADIENIDRERKASLEKELSQVERKISNYLTRIGQTESDSLASTYEQKIIESEKEKKRITRELEQELKNVWTPLIKKSELIESSLSLWKRSWIKNKKKLLKNIFPEWIPINEKKQVWTPTFSLVYQALSMWERDKMSMVELVGFEPTSWEASRIRDRGTGSKNLASRLRF